VGFNEVLGVDVLWWYHHKDGMSDDLKPLAWIGNSQKELRAFPEDVKDVMGYALHLAQAGGKHDAVKPLAGFGGAGVLEVVDDYDGDTYRAVYTVKFADRVYVLHAFQKKAKKGIKTPKQEIDLIRERLKLAEADHTARAKGGRT
jgi:phage-related protein